MQANNLYDQLQLGLTQLQLIITDEVAAKLIDYLIILEKWNKKINLTAVSGLSEMLRIHLLDSLSISHYIDQSRIIDVGTGAGLPGIPLALCHPDKEFVLLDSNGKKTRFLSQACHELGINNATVENNRAKAYVPEQCFDIIISRAFASIRSMIEHTQHLCCQGGRFFAMKGKFPEDEIEAISSQYQIAESHLLEVPGVDAVRHLIIIEENRSG